MEKAFYVQLQQYAPLLKAARIAFKEDDKYVTAGNLLPVSGYMVYLTCKTIRTPELLKVVLPYLKQTRLPFRLIKNQAQQYRLNSGAFGDSESGKVISIYIDQAEHLSSITKDLATLTAGFKGPIIEQAQQLSEIVYLQKITNQFNQVLLSCPQLKSIPFPVAKQYRKKIKRNAMLGGAYLPVQTLRTSSKGDVLKAINLKRFAFNWCLIKKGKSVALDDHFDRDMKDRLLWQHEIIKRIQDHVLTPQLIDYFEQKGHCYLVTEFADGKSFGTSVRDILTGTEWRGLTISKQQTILNWYLKVAILVEKIHQKGIVHRDITDSNFIILTNDEVCVIDFELSYSITDQAPNPPFLLGTFGYAAPEQLEYAIPDFKEDIYALGALLSFALTGCPPWDLLATSLQIVKAKLIRLTSAPELVALIIKCLAPLRRERPDISVVKNTLDHYLQQLNHEEPETQSVAC